MTSLRRTRLQMRPSIDLVILSQLTPEVNFTSCTQTKCWPWSRIKSAGFGRECWWQMCIYLIDLLRVFFLFYFPCGSFSCAKASSSFTLPSHRVKGTLFVPSKIGTKSQCCRHHRSDMETHHQVPSPCTRKQLWEVSSWSFPCSIIYIYIYTFHSLLLYQWYQKKQKILSGTQCLQFTCIFEILKHIETTERIWKPW